MLQKEKCMHWWMVGMTNNAGCCIKVANIEMWLLLKVWWYYISQLQKKNFKETLISINNDCTLLVETSFLGYLQILSNSLQKEIRLLTNELQKNRILIMTCRSKEWTLQVYHQRHLHYLPMGSIVSLSILITLRG